MTGYPPGFKFGNTNPLASTFSRKPTTDNYNSILQQTLNIARALMFQSHIPLSYWSYIVSYVVYLSTLSTLVLNNQSPFQVLLLASTSPKFNNVKGFRVSLYSMYSIWSSY